MWKAAGGSVVTWTAGCATCSPAVAFSWGQSVSATTSATWTTWLVLLSPWVTFASFYWTSTTRGNFILFIAMWTNPQQHFEFLISYSSQRQPCSRCLGTTPLTLILHCLGSSCRKLCIQPNRSACRMCNGLLTVVLTYWNWLKSTPESQ